MKATINSLPTVMKVLNSLENLPDISDGKHRIVVHNGKSKNWWDHPQEKVSSVEITATRIHLYL